MIRSLYFTTALFLRASIEGPRQKRFGNPNVAPQPDFSSPHACWLHWVYQFPGSFWSPFWKLAPRGELSLPLDTVLLQAWSSGKWFVKHNGQQLSDFIGQFPPNKHQLVLKTRHFSFVWAVLEPLLSLLQLGKAQKADFFFFFFFLKRSLYKKDWRHADTVSLRSNTKLFSTQWQNWDRFVIWNYSAELYPTLRLSQYSPEKKKILCAPWIQHVSIAVIY